MSETVKQLMKRKRESAEKDLEKAKITAGKMIADATKNAEKLVSFHEGQVIILSTMEELDWKFYARNELGLE